jgi:membrane glycosyltransferase
MRRLGFLLGIYALFFMCNITIWNLCSLDLFKMNFTSFEAQENLFSLLHHLHADFSIEIHSMHFNMLFTHKYLFIILLSCTGRKNSLHTLFTH